MSNITTRRDRNRAVAAASGRERTLESLALGVGSVAFIVSALVALLVFRLQDLPIGGPGSIGQYAAIASAAGAFLAFLAGQYIGHPQGSGLTFLRVVDIAALGFAHAVIALLTWTLLADIMERAFIDAEVFGLPSVLLAGAATAATAYVSFYSSTHMDQSMLAAVLALFLIEGILASMLTASDPLWWEMNLSALGMTDDLSARTFNLTLIVAGVIVTGLARSVTRGIPTPHPTGLRGVRICLVLVGIFLACVGIFHVDDFFALHTAVASGMAVAFGVLVIRLRSWIPDIPQPFLWLGWLFIAVIVFTAVLFGIGYYTLTAVELIAGILVFVWIILFIRNAAALRADVAGA